MIRTEIRLTGFGGQGIILAAYVLGKAASVVEGRHATLNQSFGPEARGSACSAQLVLSDEPISYPYVRQSDLLVAMSQDAYRRFVDEIKPQGLVLHDDSLVTPERGQDLRHLGVAATRLAEGLGKRIVANMVMVGFCTAVCGLAAEDSVRQAIRTSVPTGTEELNLAAFEAGLEEGHRAAPSGPVLEEVGA
jgi:2-oxoglutarate ferredoxin oxidoreductase subunit gamma